MSTTEHGWIVLAAWRLLSPASCANWGTRMSPCFSEFAGDWPLQQHWAGFAAPAAIFCSTRGNVAVQLVVRSPPSSASSARRPAPSLSLPVLALFRFPELLPSISETSLHMHRFLVVAYCLSCKLIDIRPTSWRRCSLRKRKKKKR